MLVYDKQERESRISYFLLYVQLRGNFTALSQTQHWSFAIGLQVKLLICSAAARLNLRKFSNADGERAPSGNLQLQTRLLLARDYSGVQQCRLNFDSLIGGSASAGFR